MVLALHMPLHVFPVKQHFLEFAPAVHGRLVSAIQDPKRVISFGFTAGWVYR